MSRESDVPIFRPNDHLIRTFGSRARYEARRVRQLDEAISIVLENRSHRSQPASGGVYEALAHGREEAQDRAEGFQNQRERLLKLNERMFVVK